MTTYAIQPRAMYNVTAMNCKSMQRVSVHPKHFITTASDFAFIVAATFIAGMIAGFAWWCMV